jgi:soluble lytic murein transglycosylase-like protein
VIVAMRRRALLILGLLGFPHALASQAFPPLPSVKEATLCSVLEAAAQRNSLPFAFFTRLIWQESQFDPSARSPAGAQGVAQFMPETAKERGLVDPFEPARALDESAAYLQDLRGQFGNLGLAAAAYNAGPGRLRRWLAGAAGLPQETINYVVTVTGRDADEWRATPPPSLTPEPNFSCLGFVGDAGRRNYTTSATSDDPNLPPPKAWAVILIASFNRTAVTAEYAVARAKLARVFDVKASAPVASLRSSGASTSLLSASSKPVPSVPGAIGVSDGIGGAPVPIIRRRHLGSESAKKYVVQIETNDRADGNRICKRLESAGAFCDVLRNASRRNR